MAVRVARCSDFLLVGHRAAVRVFLLGVLCAVRSAWKVRWCSWPARLEAS